MVGSGAQIADSAARWQRDGMKQNASQARKIHWEAVVSGQLLVPQWFRIDNTEDESN
jgi:hypothetical protein